MNRSKGEDQKELYRTIIQLPFVDYKEDFENYMKKILKSKHINQDLKGYLEDKEKIKNYWAKAFMKNNFTCGMCTSSRIESKHRVYKTYLNSTTRLTELFKVFKTIEEKEISVFDNEIKKLKKKDHRRFNKCDIIKKFKPIFSEYAIAKFTENLIDSINYSVKKLGRKWYLIFLLT